MFAFQRHPQAFKFSPDFSPSQDLTAQACWTRLDGMNQHAVALGRLGGLRGGPARAATLSPERRREISRQAATFRWSAVDRRQRIHTDRLFRRRVAKRLATESGLDEGDLEHALFNLTLTPMERLSRCLARSR